MIRRDFLKVLGLSVPALQRALAQSPSGKTLIVIFLLVYGLGAAGLSVSGG